MKTTALVIALLTLAGLTQAQRPEPETTEIRGHDMVQVLNPGDIPAIYEPTFVAVEQADSLFHPEEPLLVFPTAGSARGYSTWQLDHHEVVNDRPPDGPIAATW